MVSPDNVAHRLSHWSAADFGASKSVEQAFTRAELGYVSLPDGHASRSLFAYAFVRSESEQKSSRSETIREPVIGIPVWVMISACGRAERRKYVGNCDAVTAGGAIRS